MSRSRSSRDALRPRPLTVDDVHVSGSPTASSFGCALCNDGRKYSRIDNFVDHITNAHSDLIDSTYSDSLKKTVFCAQARKLTGQDIPTSLSFIGQNTIRCPGCSSRVVLHGPYTVANFVQHLTRSRCCEAKSATPKKRPPSVNDKSPMMTTPKKKLRLDESASSVSAVDDSLSNGLSTTGSVDQGTRRQPGTMQSTQLSSEQQIQNAVRLYRYMATPVENSNRPAYRPFLMRNLSFLPKSKALGAAHKKKRNKVKKEPSPFVTLLKSPSEEEHSRTASVQFHSFRDKELPGSRKACVELYLRTVTGKARELIRLPSAKFSISVNAPELMTTIDLPRDVGTPCRNGTISRSYYLVVHTVVSEQQDAISSGGRSLRNVPSRQAIMADRNGLRSHKAKERRSDEKKQQLELFGILLLADATRETSGLIERTVAIPLVEHRAKDWRTSVDFPEQILELSKKTKTGPFMRVTVTREADDSDSDESEDSRSVKSTSHISSSSASVASVKGSALEGALRDASIPCRLLYRWIQGFKELTDNVVSPRDELEGFTTEPPHPDRCIFCGYRFSDLYSLLKHMRLNYPRFEFVYNKATAQVYLPTVDVHVKRNFDGRYEGNPIRQFRNGMLSGPTKYAVNSHMEVIISNKCEARFKRKQSQQRDLVEFSRPTEKLVNRLTRSLNGHVRTYFNARTRQPLPAPPSKPTPVLTDPDWLKSAIARKMDEFSDLNNGEKQLMVMWNVFLAKKEHRCIGDCMLMRALCKFIDAHGKQIVSKHLLGNFFCHLANLEEQGLITGEQISTLVSMITQI